MSIVQERIKVLTAHNGYWFNQLKAYKNRNTDAHHPNIVVADGCIFHLKWENTPFKGFGGYMFTFTSLTDGTVVKCNNCWNGEEVPEILRPLMQDTHTRLSEYK